MISTNVPGADKPAISSREAAINHGQEAMTQKPNKTQAQLDDEFRAKMEERAGDGGASGVEYEDGQPVAMKRSVKNNMFRYI